MILSSLTSYTGSYADAAVGPEIGRDRIRDALVTCIEL